MRVTDGRKGVRAGRRPWSRLGAWAAYLAAERRFLLITSIVVMLASSLPVVLGYATAPDDRWFAGLVYNVHDAAQYLSWMREAGRSLFAENMLTSESNPAVFLNLHWWVPGRLGAMAGLSLPQTFQAYRLLAIPLAVVSLSLFCRLLFVDPTRRRYCLLLTIGTSGLGWIWVVDKYLAGRADILHPLDVHGLSGNVFWTMVSSPHLVLALGLLFLTLAVAYVGCWSRGPWVSVLAGALALLLGLGHIYDLVTVWAVLAVFGLVVILQGGWSTRVFVRLLVVVAMSAPSVAYWGWVSSDANPVWQQALGQYGNLASTTPSPPHLVVFLGITFLAALSRLVAPLPSRGDARIWLLVKAWLVTTLVLVYLPLPFQITLLAGYPLPMAALATATLYEYARPRATVRRRRGRVPFGASLRRRWSPWLPYLFLILVLPTNLYLVAWRVVDLRRHDYPYYLHRDDAAAMEWLATNARPEEVVLTSFSVGHYLPGMAGTKAYLANAVMTTDFGHKQEEVRLFYSEETGDPWRRAFLQDGGIDYVVHGPSERRLGAFDPGRSDLLEPTLVLPETRVYRVRP